MRFKVRIHSQVNWLSVRLTGGPNRINYDSVRMTQYPARSLYRYCTGGLLVQRLRIFIRPLYSTTRKWGTKARSLLNV